MLDIHGGNNKGKLMLEYLLGILGKAGGNRLLKYLVEITALGNTWWKYMPEIATKITEILV